VSSLVRRVYVDVSCGNHSVMQGDDWRMIGSFCAS